MNAPTADRGAAYARNPRATMRSQGRTMRWYDLLTLDHTVCRICHNAGVQTRIITDPAVTALRSHPRTRAAYVAKQKAAFRRHVAAAHPDWADRVRWVKD